MLTICAWASLGHAGTVSTLAINGRRAGTSSSGVSYTPEEWDTSRPHIEHKYLPETNDDVQSDAFTHLEILARNAHVHSTAALFRTLPSQHRLKGKGSSTVDFTITVPAGALDEAACS